MAFSYATRILAAIPRNSLQKCTKRLLLGDPNTPKNLLLWFSTTMMASFLLSISVFLFALSTFFTQSENYAGALQPLWRPCCSPGWARGHLAGTRACGCSVL